MRLVTRADLDGLACAVLLQEVEPIDSVEFAHPKDVQDGKADIDEYDILANLPYDARVGMWFDHHSSQRDAVPPGEFDGAYDIAPSAARVIANHYGHSSFQRYAELLSETDRLDSAQLDVGDVVDPQGWILLGYTLDPRTGLGAFKNYFLKLMGLCASCSLDEILADEEVARRVENVRADQKAFADHLRDVTHVEGNVIITDVRGKADLPVGNRFLIYTLFPTGNVSVRLADGKANQFVTVQVGHSIFNRTCRTDVGELMHKHGGGGHKGAGTCQPSLRAAEGVIADVIESLKGAG